MTLLTFVLLLSTISPQAAASPAPQALPAFRLVAPDGAPVDSATLARAGQTLLVFVTPGTPSADRLVSAFGEWASASLAEHTVLVLAGDLATCRAWFERAAPDATRSMRWYADPDRAGWAALAVSQPQALFGLRGGGVEWSVNGVLNDPKMLESAVRNWVR